MSSKGVNLVKIDPLPLDSNLVKLLCAHLETVPKGSEEPGYLHMEDPAVFAEEYLVHPTPAAAASNDDNPFNNGNNCNEDWEDHVVISTTERRSNHFYHNNASLTSLTCHLIYRRQQNHLSTSMEKQGWRTSLGQFLPTTMRL